VTKVKCDNCVWGGNATETLPIENLVLRVTPGGIVPHGECPMCGALCYEDKTPGFTERPMKEVVVSVRESTVSRWLIEVPEEFDEDKIVDYFWSVNMNDSPNCYRMNENAAVDVLDKEPALKCGLINDKDEADEYDEGWEL